MLVNIKLKHDVDLAEPNLNDLLADGVGASPQVSLCQRSANSWNVLICSGFDAPVIIAHSVRSSSNKPVGNSAIAYPFPYVLLKPLQRSFLGKSSLGLV